VVAQLNFYTLKKVGNCHAVFDILKVIINTTKAATSRIPMAFDRTDVNAGAYVSANHTPPLELLFKSSQPC
jgi:hypothetical protein